MQNKRQWPSTFGGHDIIPPCIYPSVELDHSVDIGLIMLGIGIMIGGFMIIRGKPSQ